jgi:hypothetical protein
MRIGWMTGARREDGFMTWDAAAQLTWLFRLCFQMTSRDSRTSHFFKTIKCLQLSCFHQVPSSHSGRHVEDPISRYFRWAHQVCILPRFSAVSSNKIGLPFSARVGVRGNCFRRPELAGQLARVRVISWLGWWREEAH